MAHFKIELTKEQIELLTKSAKEKLMSDKQKEIAAIELKYTKAVAALESKFKSYSISIDEEPETKNEKRTLIKLPENLLRECFAAGDTIKEMIEKIPGSKEQSIRAKLLKLGLKMADQPKKK